MSPEEWREHVKRSLASEMERTLDERVERYLSIDRQQLVPSHHFTPAITECFKLYRDGNFLSCTMVSQAIVEALVRFVAERNGFLPADKEQKPELAARLNEAGVVTAVFVEAVTRIHRSFRNDFHHMNPQIARIDIVSLATRNAKDLAAVQNEIFGFSLQDGLLIPTQKKYWDIKPDGTVLVQMTGH
jgi:hypothetical protein